MNSIKNYFIIYQDGLALPIQPTVPYCIKNLLKNLLEKISKGETKITKVPNAVHNDSNYHTQQNIFKLFGLFHWHGLSMYLNGSYTGLLTYFKMEYAFHLITVQRNAILKSNDKKEKLNRFSIIFHQSSIEE